MLQITKNVNNYPSHEDVKNIFNETYNVFYKKWRSISSPDDWSILMQEARDIGNKYDFDLCRQILVELIEVIEDGFKKREVKDE